MSDRSRLPTFPLGTEPRVGTANPGSTRVSAFPADTVSRQALGTIKPNGGAEFPVPSSFLSKERGSIGNAPHSWRLKSATEVMASQPLLPPIGVWVSRALAHPRRNGQRVIRMRLTNDVYAERTVWPGEPLYPTHDPENEAVLISQENPDV
jgi:hypothetical protein